ncbi:MAG: helix-turn-helix domain-containing protein [Neptuniibacter sp.]
MHSVDIIYAIHKADSSLSKIANMDGVKVSPSLVTMVIRGERTSHKVAYAISQVTGIPTEKMWPGKYLTPPAYKLARGDNNLGRLPQKKEAVNA